MTLDEALEILEKERKDHHSFPTDIIGKAEGLGIEALKRLANLRDNPGLSPVIPLAGETKE